MNKILPVLFCGILLMILSCTSPQYTQWPDAGIECKPGARWWWMGSAVDSANISSLMQQYAEVGLGTMEITPIYGVQGNDSAEISFLSDRWMQMLGHTEAEAQNNNMLIDMNTGTGWPFGGPKISLDDAARCMIVSKYFLSEGQILSDTIAPVDAKQRNTAQLLRLMAFDENDNCINLTSKVDSSKMLNWTASKGQWTLYAVFCGHTFQQVKRAARGGEGLVLNHFSKHAVENYLTAFSEAFEKSNTALPHNFFNDSYEVYKADCTPDIFEEFERLRGYKLEEYLPEFFSDEKTDTVSRLVSDYCETLSDLLHDNFTATWTNWAHGLGGSTRNQAHGSPANLIDIYAAVDVPECEGFGLSDFGIRGLRKDSLTRPNDSDFSMLKYASSAAHISGHNLVSSETFTWLTEHFRTSFSQCKPDLDLMFVSGVNHVYFHGTTYSPVEAEWPGWKFYASVDMSPTNPLWRDAKPFFKYIERSQSFLQMGSPDNDFLVYLPIYDIWYEQSQRLLQLSIHDMAKRAPKFIDVINGINAAGYDVDYVSDKFLRSASVNSDGSVSTTGGSRYKAVVIPGVRFMPTDVLEHLYQMASNGATIIFSECYPQSAPGLFNLEANKVKYEELIKVFPCSDFSATTASKLKKGLVITGCDYAQLLLASGVDPEAMKTQCGLQCIRRSNSVGHHYFVTNLSPNDVDDWIPLAVAAKSALLFDPMNGNVGKAELKYNESGKPCVRLQLASGQSILIRTFSSKNVDSDNWVYQKKENYSQTIDKGWSVRFLQSVPDIPETFEIDTLCAWTAIDDERCRINMGTAVYSSKFVINKDDLTKHFQLDLGDVRETARVRINGENVATLWAVPYQCQIEKFLKNGENTIEIEMTGLPANHISDLDKQKVAWRRFKEINIVDIKYRKTTYENWVTVPCGLLGPVRIIEN